METNIGTITMVKITHWYLSFTMNVLSGFLVPQSTSRDSCLKKQQIPGQSFQCGEMLIPQNHLIIEPLCSIEQQSVFPYQRPGIIDFHNKKLLVLLMSYIFVNPQSWL